MRVGVEAALERAVARLEVGGVEVEASGGVRGGSVREAQQEEGIGVGRRRAHRVAGDADEGRARAGGAAAPARLGRRCGRGGGRGEAARALGTGRRRAHAAADAAVAAMRQLSAKSVRQAVELSSLRCCSY
jgi:hypothetical protein